MLAPLKLTVGSSVAVLQNRWSVHGFQLMQQECAPQRMVAIKASSHAHLIEWRSFKPPLKPVLRCPLSTQTQAITGSWQTGAPREAWTAAAAGSNAREGSTALLREKSKCHFGHGNVPEYA